MAAEVMTIDFDGCLYVPKTNFGLSPDTRESCMLRRHFNAPPLSRLLQASVLVALAAGLIMLAMHTESGNSRIAIDATASNVIVAP